MALSDTPLPVVTPTVGRLRLGRVAPHILGAASAVALGAAGLPAMAQESKPTQLPAISVEGQKPAGSPADPAVDYKIDRVQSGKFTEPLLDTPQTINVIPQSVIEERAATTLKDVIRSTPGITALGGEGGGAQGDNFRIRGFAANNDMTLDGMRDMAQTTRDPFNLEQIEIFKGPSSSYAGRGSTGGTLNQVSKTAKRNAFQNADITVGTNETLRATVDVNQPLDGWLGLDGAALRLNALGHQSEVEGRDLIENERWGFAPTLALGMNKPTRVTVSYFHLSQDNKPDYGLPLINGRVPDQARKSGYYGLYNIETEQTETDVGTMLFEHDFNDTYTLRNQLRYGEDQRYMIVSPPRISAAYIAANQLGHNSTTGTGNASGRDSKNTLLINQTDVTSRFDTGFAGHTLVTGLELSRETYRNAAFSYTGVPIGNLSNPNPYQSYGTYSRGALSQVETQGAALYAFDTIKLDPQWELVTGLRWDYFDAHSDSTATTGVTTSLGRTDKEFSYRAGLVYKPEENGSVYVSYGTSFNPSAESLSLSNALTNAANVNVAPETNVSYEVGTKWDVLDKKLNLATAVFRTEKTNARTEDPNNSLDQVVLEGEQRVDGVEFNITGELTDKWKVMTGYTYMTSEVTKSKNRAELGAKVGQVPRHTYTLWTTYRLPADFTVGFGAQYVGERAISTTNQNDLSGYTVFDAMLSYQLTKNVELQLNLLNLTDEFYLETVHPGGGHGTPGAGRTALLTTSLKF